MTADCHTADVTGHNDRGLSHCERHRTQLSRTATLRTSEDTMIEDCHTVDVRGTMMEDCHTADVRGTMIQDCHTADIRGHNDRGLPHCGRHRIQRSRTVTLRTPEDTMIENCHTADVRGYNDRRLSHCRRQRTQ